MALLSRAKHKPGRLHKGGAPLGNTNGAKGKFWSDAVRAACSRPFDQRRKYLQALAEKLCELAMGGDISAMKEIGDRLDGKVPLQIAGPDGGKLEIVVNFNRTGVDANEPG